MKFVFIPGGSFFMGSPSDEFSRNNDEWRHRVTLTKGFYMQTTEVTQRQWKSLMRSNPSKYDFCGSDCPVENVSWNDVSRFIKKLNKKEQTKKYRLPSEAEWEYSCRAGTKTIFNVGDFLSSDQANFNGNYPIPGSPRGINRNSTMAVGSFRPNEFGLYDMHGNVYEWCRDWYGEYPALHVKDPKGPEAGRTKVCRGGGLSSYARRCRSANRTKHLPDYHNFYIGFRIVADCE